MQDKLNAQKNLLKGCNEEINEAHAEKSQLIKDVSNTQLQVQELEHKVNKCNKDTNDAAKLVSCFLFFCVLLLTPLGSIAIHCVYCRVAPNFGFGKFEIRPFFLQSAKFGFGQISGRIWQTPMQLQCVQLVT